ncbi:MAG: DUF1987 domain-containing protein [Flavobacteriales bacterium]|nr:DUF1987 domain-containing protein [Flavobacteriales bacterium]
MDSLIIAAREDSPGFNLDVENGIFEITGESRPENVQGFYKPVMEWMDKFQKYVYWLKNQFPDKEPRKIDFHFKLDYFNSTSAKYILSILNTLDEINQQTHSVTIHWHYEEMDEDILKTGEAFEEVLKIRFNYVLIPSVQDT